MATAIRDFKHPFLKLKKVKIVNKSAANGYEIKFNNMSILFNGYKIYLQ
jgi:hypothetical protein